MRPEDLRDAGYETEAARLTKARKQSEAWKCRPSERTNDRALALSVFGSKRYDELAVALGLETWS